MKKYIPALFVIGLAALLLFASQEIKQHPQAVLKSAAALEKNCFPGSIRCQFIAPITRDAHNITHGLNRINVSKDDLPIVRIYLSDGSIAKLETKRRSVLALPRPIHISTSDDWVKGRAAVEYEGRKEQSKVSIRLKGDWGDHLIYPKKISFRIKTRSGGYLFGMKRLSIQHPSTRAYGIGPMLLTHMRSLDILAPRQKFVDVYVNDFSVGIMAMEEHFGKEMLEAQNRRDGPILAVNEDPLWAQMHINSNVAPIDNYQGTNFFGYRDGALKDYNAARFVRGSIATNNQLRGQALLRDFLDGRAQAGEVFDYDRLSKYWILTNIWGGCHSAIWHNRRFYFNPISGLLEPISFDNDAAPHKFKVCADIDVLAALSDPLFVTAVQASAAEIRTDLTSPEFAELMAAQQDGHDKYFSFETFVELPGLAKLQGRISPDLLINNLDNLMNSLDAQTQENGSIDGTALLAPLNYFGEARGGYLHPYQGILDEEFLQKQENINTHLTAYYYPSQNSGVFEFRNLTLGAIELKSIYVTGKNNYVRALNFTPMALASAAQTPTPVQQSVTVSDKTLSKYKNFKLDYLYKGKPYTRTVQIQFKNTVSGYVSNPLTAVLTLVGEGGIDGAHQRIVFSRRTYNITESIALPKGWGVEIMPGAKLNFEDGAVLKISGPLTAQGTKTAPIIINVDTSETFMDIGAWGGIFVSKSPQRSEVNYLELYGTGTQNLQNRQGYYGLTGCMSFYESDVDIRNSKFINAQCEDALNIVKADFVLDNIVIDGARADAFDSDFSTGTVQNSVFENSGNDGIDVSGTQLSVIDVTMTNIGDKAISVGEKSNLNGTDIFIEGAVLGIVSKDLSVALVTSTRFENIEGTALMTYIKKQEYGPSSITCEACTFLEGTVKTGQQETTKIMLNGTPVGQTKLTRTQMVQAGLIEQAEAQ